MGRSKAWSPAELSYRLLAAPWGPALELFSFAGAWAPPAEQIDFGWAAWEGERVHGALIVERAGTNAMLHGPVVVAPADAPPEMALEVAGELLSGAIRHAEGVGIDTLFTRPQGLDRIWVRHGFLPVPEPLLPKALHGRPGLGLYGWRGGSALWSAAGRGMPRARADARR
ncbi:MAG TPA: hypothetical protein VMS64_34275 [Candidatus Methylomirabilis sp.]|nr:hypothetical protein [Candidatus Methylomirabilis sp.]